MLIWATGNSTRNFVLRLIETIPEQTNRRGFLVNGKLKLNGSLNIFALGDCTITKYPATAQVAFQQGCFLAKYFGKLQKWNHYVTRCNMINHNNLQVNSP